MPQQSLDCREAIHWFINNAGLYLGSSRGLFATDFSDEYEAVLEAAIISLKAKSINPLILTGSALYAQADYLWRNALEHTTFGRPVASKVELDISGSDVVIIKDLEAPEAAHHLWYLFHHVVYPRALFNKPLLITSPLTYEEFITYGAGCADLEFASRKVTWEKLLWVLNATLVDLPHFRIMRNEDQAVMLKPEYNLFKAMKERGLEVVPQHVIGDYMLDFAIADKVKKVDIEVDVFACIDPNKPSPQELQRNVQLLNDGWKVLRFSCAEIMSNVSACVDAVEEVWQQGRKKSASGRLISGTQAPAVPHLPVDDDSQKFAITHGAGPAAVTGGAGTGKSSCIVNRVAYLLAHGVNPEKILVITFSPECAQSMRQALDLAPDRQLTQKINLFCWHDLGFKVLKENLSAIKRKPPVKVEGSPQKALKRLLDKAKKDLDPTMLELSEELDEFILASLISLYKANLVSPKHLRERAKTGIDELVSKVYQGYEDQLQKANRIDRDDMVSLAAQLLVDDSEVRTKYQYQYDFVFVDEYQDATAAGDLLARLLAFPQDNVYLVGDEDESIHETRGSLPRLMSEVSIRLPNARCYMLEKNWRCHPTIVDHARQALLGLTRRRIQKDMLSGWGQAPTTAIIGPQVLDNENTEAEWVADEIGILIDSGRLPKDIAVIYQEHNYATLLEEAIARRGIRCVAANSQKGSMPDEVGDVMAFLTLVMDPDGPKARESFERICQLRVKEVNPTLSATIASFAESNNLSYLKGIEIYQQAVQDPSCRELEQLVRIIRTMNQEKLPPAETISLLKRTQRLAEYYRSLKVPAGVTYEPMKKLAQLEEEARKFQVVADFVKHQQSIQQSANGSSGSEKALEILSIHETKGREFNVAFVVGLADGLLPATASGDPEEDRRLFYVAMTRAKEMLYLSLPSQFNGETRPPSAFLIEAKLMPPNRQKSAVPGMWAQAQAHGQPTIQNVQSAQTAIPPHAGMQSVTQPGMQGVPQAQQGIMSQGAGQSTVRIQQGAGYPIAPTKHISSRPEAGQTPASPAVKQPAGPQFPVQSTVPAAANTQSGYPGQTMAGASVSQAVSTTPSSMGISGGQNHSGMQSQMGTRTPAPIPGRAGMQSQGVMQNPAGMQSQGVMQNPAGMQGQGAMQNPAGMQGQGVMQNPAGMQGQGVMQNPAGMQSQGAMQNPAGGSLMGSHGSAAMQHAQGTAGGSGVSGEQSARQTATQPVGTGAAGAPGPAAPIQAQQGQLGMTLPVTGGQAQPMPVHNHAGQAGQMLSSPHGGESMQSRTPAEFPVARETGDRVAGSANKSANFSASAQAQPAAEMTASQMAPLPSVQELKAKIASQSGPILPSQKSAAGQEDIDLMTRAAMANEAARSVDSLFSQAAVEENKKSAASVVQEPTSQAPAMRPDDELTPVATPQKKSRKAGRASEATLETASSLESDAAGANASGEVSAVLPTKSAQGSPAVAASDDAEIVAAPGNADQPSVTASANLQTPEKVDVVTSLRTPPNVVAPEGGAAAPPDSQAQGQRRWQSEWEKQTQQGARSVPITPRSVFDPPPQVVAEQQHEKHARPGELDLTLNGAADQAVLPPQKHAEELGASNAHGWGWGTADQGQPLVDQGQTPAKEGQLPASAAEGSVDDISDLLELASKAPSKKKNAPAQNQAAQSFQPQNWQTPSASVEEELDYPFQTAGMKPVNPSPSNIAPVASGQNFALSAPATDWRQGQPAGSVGAPPDDHHPRCPHCSTLLEGGSRFCGECGYTLPERIPTCPRCGCALEPSAKFCGECGAKRTMDASSIGITQAQLSAVPQEALTSSETFKRWMDSMNPNKQETWMVKLLRFLEQ